MKKLILLHLCLLLTVQTFAGETAEPLQGYTVHLDNQTVHLYSGQTATVPGVFENPSITIVEDAERTFAYGDLTFKYPAYFTFEAEIDEVLHKKDWTLSGNDVKLMIFVIPGEQTPEKYVSYMKGNYMSDAEISDISHNLGGKRYSGKRIIAHIGNIGFIQDALLISKGNHSVLFIIQDAPEAQKKSKKETERVLKLLETTFTTKE